MWLGLYLFGKRVFNIMWRIIHAAAALVCGFCLWPLSVCSTIQHSPIFQAPCCFNFSFIFWRFPLSFLFLRNVACRTCLLPCVGWEWLGVLRGDQRVIAAEAPRMDGILKRAVCPLSPRAAVEKLQDTPLLPQKPPFDVRWIHLSSSRPDWSWMRHPLVTRWPQMPPPLWLWLTCLWTHGRRCANTCTPEGGRWAALLHTGATVEGQVCSLIFFILDDMLSCSSGSRFKKKKIPNGYFWSSGKDLLSESKQTRRQAAILMIYRDQP